MSNPRFIVAIALGVVVMGLTAFVVGLITANALANHSEAFLATD